MTDRERSALENIQNSKNYREICPRTVERIFLAKLPSYKSLKETDKAVRAQLHQISGAFMTPEEIRSACALARDYASGRREALEEALQLHSSTRERGKNWRGLYEEVFDAMGKRPESALDLACGLNPIALGAMGVENVYGMDIQGGAIRVVTEWAHAAGWQIHAQCDDLLCGPVLPRADLAIMMKLLPLLERQREGAAEELLAACPAKHLLVTFPTRTLGGRNVGMEEQYSRWMDGHMPTGLSLIKRFPAEGEICYLLQRRQG